VEVGGIGERPARPGLVGDPRRMLEERAERGDEGGTVAGVQPFERDVDG
jgi:hypothetical protein